MQTVSQMMVREENLTNDIPARQPRRSAALLKLRCAVCGGDSVELPYESLAQQHAAITCKVCSFVLMQEDGIWRALTADRQRYFAQFVREYEEVRKVEGRGSERPEFYLALPYSDATGTKFLAVEHSRAHLQIHRAQHLEGAA